MNCDRTKELGQLQLFTAKIVLVFLKNQPVVVVVQVKLTCWFTLVGLTQRHGDESYFSMTRDFVGTLNHPLTKVLM